MGQNSFFRGANYIYGAEFLFRGANYIYGAEFLFRGANYIYGAEFLFKVRTTYMGHNQVSFLEVSFIEWV